jgi:hypothetical protein
MAYDPRNLADRRNLAAAVIKALHNADFMEEYVEDKGVKERVFTRAITGANNTRVAVYTGVVGEGDRAECRKVGADAIRVCVLYRSTRTDKEQGIIKTTRVHRTGEVEAVIERMLGRMREAWGKVSRNEHGTCPQCGAPTFVSKAKNTVCADFCWKTDADLRSAYRPARSNQRRRSFRSYRA